jgi:large subunit ribosomal protein L6
MSRIGRQPIPIPGGVKVTIDNNRVRVAGPKGTVERVLHPEMVVRMEEHQLVVERPTDERRHRALHGLTRTLVSNMVVGVSSGFRKDLEVVGVSYRAEMQGESLRLNLGFSHPVVVDPPDNVQFSIDQRRKVISIEGIDKEVVGQLAADIRKLRPPEPYQGKGLRYAGEHVRRKAGKTGKV